MNENRELIEEFLGKNHPLVRTMSAPEYDNSYSWIMPVYQKICDVLRKEYPRRKENIVNTFFSKDTFTDANQVYHACVGFIKWYKLEQEIKS